VQRAVTLLEASTLLAKAATEPKFMFVAETVQVG
jgi:hypothetical protein